MKKIFVNILLLSILIIFSMSCSNDSEESADNINNENTELNDSLIEKVSDENLMRGKVIYANNCQTCHQEDGLGVEGAFPALDSLKAEINIIVNGVEGSTMVAFKDELSNEEIIDVINYVNNSWGKNFGKTSLKNIEEVK